jgi:hypothetical protein
MARKFTRSDCDWGTLAGVDGEFRCGLLTRMLSTNNRAEGRRSYGSLIWGRSGPLAAMRCLNNRAGGRRSYGSLIWGRSGPLTAMR